MGCRSHLIRVDVSVVGVRVRPGQKHSAFWTFSVPLLTRHGCLACAVADGYRSRLPAPHKISEPYVQLFVAHYLAPILLPAKHLQD